MNQYNLNFNNKVSFSQDNFLVSDSNKLAYQFLIDTSIDENNILLLGPNKSGKSHLANIWCVKNNALEISLNETNIKNIGMINQNILIDNFLNDINEEKLFHIINDFKQKNKKILLTTSNKPSNFKFSLKDLSSRIKSFHLIKINMPDDYLLSNLIIKLFNDKQLKIKNKDVINYIVSHIERSFDSVYTVVKKIDDYSLSNSRDITIPLIKEII